MNKQEFVKHIAELHNIKISEANNIVNQFTDAVTAALKNGQSVEILGFGAFTSKHTPAKQGRNPKTGDPITISARNTPTFKAGKNLKDAVNHIK